MADALETAPSAPPAPTEHAAGGRCTCLWLPDEDGRPLPQAWVTAHRHATLRTHDGRVASGFYSGIWGASDNGRPILLMEIEQDDGETFMARPDEVASCTPSPGITGPDHLLLEVGRAVARLLDEPQGDHDPLTYIVDGHTAITVTLAYEQLRCEPTRDALEPPFSIRFEGVPAPGPSQ